MARDRGDLGDADMAYRAGLRIAQRLAEADPTNAAAQRDLSISYNKIGNVAWDRGDADAAETAYKACVRILRRLADAEPSNTVYQ
ncbi:MAG: tetratricopeptide repeat protein [Actinoplanes sp.]